MTMLGREDAPPTPRELLRALRYPDRSVVIDLSRLPHDEKLHYVRIGLACAERPQTPTGLPHRILLDEAHYYLHDTDAPQLLDFERNRYTVVTYCASRLPQALLASTEVMIVTCESNPAEMEALRARCAGCAGIDRSRWAALGRLKVGQAIALPITDEAGGKLRLFTIAPRLTPHVRHRDNFDGAVSGRNRRRWSQGGIQRSRRAAKKKTGIYKTGASFNMFSFDTSDTSRTDSKPRPVCPSTTTRSSVAIDISPPDPAALVAEGPRPFRG